MAVGVDLNLVERPQELDVLLARHRLAAAAAALAERPATERSKRLVTVAWAAWGVIQNGVICHTVDAT